MTLVPVKTEQERQLVLRLMEAKLGRPSTEYDRKERPMFELK